MKNTIYHMLNVASLISVISTTAEVKYFGNSYHLGSDHFILMEGVGIMSYFMLLNCIV